MSINATAMDAPRSRKLIDVKSMADLLDLPASTIYERARTGKMPGIVRIGTRLKFDAAKIDAWLDAGGDLGEKP